MINPTENPLLAFARNLPKISGIYKYFNEEDEIIYVGKAKNLKHRVSSYFLKSNQLNQKTRKLVSEIRRIEYAVVDTETDALLLENNLIKQYQPKYNILLKDDKTYPYICVTNERFPRVVATRILDRSQGKFYGPFASVIAMNTVIDLLRKLYPIRTCTYNLSAKNIENQKFNVCLEYHIKNCKAPCVGYQTETHYQADMVQIQRILSGKMTTIKTYFREKMQESAEKLAFEEAQVWKNKFDLLEKFQSKSLITNPNITNVDVFTIISDEHRAYYNFMHIEDGCITKIKTNFIRKKLEESDGEILRHVISDYLQAHETQRIIANIEPEEIELENVLIALPKIGDLKKLVEMSVKNALMFKKERTQSEEERKKYAHEKRIIETLQKDLNLVRKPKHIECFDNSNIQGTNPVSSMVCFKNGKAAKKEYRHYNIKTVVGANDFASMYEVVFRRYRRLLDEAQPLPDLIIIDGGKGQLSSATQALKDLNIYGQIPIIGIAKRLEEIYYPHDELPIHLHKKSESLTFIQRIRDEAHRFAITFHRQKRSQNNLKSGLENIEGIGKTTTEKLLKHFKSISKIREASEDEIAKIIGKHRATILAQELHKNR